MSFVFDYAPLVTTTKDAIYPARLLSYMETEMPHEGIHYLVDILLGWKDQKMKMIVHENESSHFQFEFSLKLSQKDIEVNP